MTEDTRTLNVVDENGVIVGVETRERIHREGLLHHEVHVWYYTPNSELIFQHRAKDKDTYPDLLDATVGGHVEKDADYQDTALQEMLEETGVRTDVAHLTPIQLVRSKSFDNITNKINNTLRMIYAYRYDGAVADLKVEEGKATGFEKRPITDMFVLPDADKRRFIPLILEEETLQIFRKIQTLT